MLITASTLDAAFTGFNAAFQEGFNSVTPAVVDTAPFVITVPSTTAKERYPWLKTLPGFREWVGERVVHGLETADFDVVNRPFELTIGIDRDAFDDDTYGLYKPSFTDMGLQSRLHPQELQFELLANAFTTRCYDGQYLVDADHPVGDGVVSNHQGGSGAPWFLIDTGRTIKPIIYQVRRPYSMVSMTSPTDPNVFLKKQYIYGVDARAEVAPGLWQLIYGSKQTLDQTNFNAAYAAMMQVKNDQGRTLNIVPRLLVCGPSNRAAANAVVKAATAANGSSNTNYQAVDVMIVPYLS